MDLLIAGRHLGDRYRLVAPLGAGGMAMVWRAFDDVLDREVAVKVPREDGPEEFTRRLRQEARTAAGLEHPAITSVYDYGEAELSPDGRLPFVVMELLGGESLAARLTRGPLPWTDAAAVCARLAEALAAAHEAGVVHRDVKPGNVFLTPTGVKVLDFGIAFTAAAPGDGTLLGTPGYLAPELRTGAEPTAAADVYALGLTLVEAVTGRPEPPDMDALAGAGVPEDAAAGILRCLDERPDARPPADEVAAMLGAPPPPVREREPFTDGSDSDAEADTDRRTKVLDRPAPAPAVPESGRPHRRRLLIAGSVIAGITAAAAVIAVLVPSGPPPRSEGRPVPTSPQSPPAMVRCAVAYSVTGQWPGGFQAQVRVTNLGGPVDGWRLAWSFPDGQRITQLWNGGQAQDGAAVTVTAADWNRTIAPRGTVEFGFLGRRTGSGTGGDRAPDRFTLNGQDCRAG
ncbi:protein kinase domain-containing protein [Actinomadura vinacea]|uniref:protein kinase domain-containing protein n=1 Tax=Actinomadura vinacea TaxID=115336 RepID=UPI0031D3F4FE